jgi:hypothetical protein
MFHWQAVSRIRQAGNALAARWRAVDEARLAVLMPQERALFDRLPPADRVHALRVAERLYQAGERDSSLLKAALLHDIGKAGQGIHLPHRVARVLLAAVAPDILVWLACEPSGWRRPLYALVNHASLGSIWLEAQGSDPLTVALVRYHDAPAWPSELEGHKHLWSALRAADDSE